MELISFVLILASNVGSQPTVVTIHATVQNLIISTPLDIIFLHPPARVITPDTKTYKFLRLS